MKPKKNKNKTKEDYGMFLLLKTIMDDFLPRSTSAEKPEALRGLQCAKGSANGPYFMFCNSCTIN